jgi:hypothetical protein
MKLNYPAQVHRTLALNFLGIVPVTSRTRRGEPVHVWSGIWALFRERENTRLSWCW